MMMYKPVMIETRDSNLFKYSRRFNQITAEASTLRWMTPPEVFQVKSDKTGQVRTFRRTFTSVNRHRDIAYWRYTCREDTKLNAVIFND